MNHPRLDVHMDWLHAPIHRLGSAGAYMVTAGTYLKQHFFKTGKALSLLQGRVFALAKEYGWVLTSWSFFSNHYHFVGSSDAPESLRNMLRHLHSETVREINRIDGSYGRKVWFQFWDTQLTFEKSYYARLNYVNTNPVRHGLVPRASEYPWCSAEWFESKADRRFLRKVQSFGQERIRIVDSFAPVLVEEA